MLQHPISTFTVDISRKDVFPSQNSVDFVTERASVAGITVPIWPLSVTESLELPPQDGAVVMPDIHKFDLREWLVPPILIPLVVGLIVAGAVIMRW